MKESGKKGRNERRNERMNKGKMNNGIKKEPSEERLNE